jgi:hypothetical protein
MTHSEFHDIRSSEYPRFTLSLPAATPLSLNLRWES